MLRKFIATTLIGYSLLTASTVSADPWKDESGHGKHWKEWHGGWGETPWWNRGKGYWDGHFKHGYRAYRPPVYYYQPAPRYYYYEPAPSAPYYDGWHGPEYPPY